ncbi:MAG: DUF1385 domain-containing protein [Ruminococcaceae bacterium]|nr:DUF1385 domain-containing protein [Oscillospiraceae bacterium]
MAKKEKDPRVGIVGGQAVLEGVMMKSGERCSLAVRTEEGIVIDNTKETSLRKKYKICNIPIIRGCVSFVEQLFSAMKMLTKSADMQGIDLDEPETKFEKWLNEKLGDKLMAVVGGIGMILGIVLAMGLFLLLPTYTAKGIDWLAGGFISQYSILFSLIEGLIRIAIFVAYVWLVSFMPDIRKTYEYHGAEHKSVDCFEKGLPLTPENAKTCTRFHPRCGTSFIFVVLIISIIVNSFFEIDNTAIRFASKLITIPLIVGVGFEFIKYAGGHNNILTKILSAPGLWMQRITTREPDEAQLEVALTALKNAIPEEFGGIDEPNYDPETKKMVKKSAETTEPEDTASEDAE